MRYSYIIWLSKRFNILFISRLYPLLNPLILLSLFIPSSSLTALSSFFVLTHHAVEAISRLIVTFAHIWVNARLRTTLVDDAAGSRRHRPTGSLNYAATESAAFTASQRRLHHHHTNIVSYMATDSVTSPTMRYLLNRHTVTFPPTLSITWPQ